MNYSNYSVKVALLGDPMTGKTSLSKRYVDNSFSREYKPTLGIDIYSKIYTYERGEQPLQVYATFWDMSGHKQFSQLRKSYFKGLNGAIVAFDITRTIDVDGRILPWIKELFEIREEFDLPLAIIATKIDIKPVQGYLSEQDVREGIRIETKDRKIGYFETSALTGENVEEAFKWILDHSIEWISQQ